MKKQMILMFGLLMLFTLTIDTATAQIPETTTRTELEPNEYEEDKCERRVRKRKNKRKASTAKAKNRRGRTGGVKPPKDRITKSTKFDKPVKPTRSVRDVAVIKNKKGNIKNTKVTNATSVRNGKAIPMKYTPTKNKGKVILTKTKAGKAKGNIRPNKHGAAKCGIAGCEHPGKHEGLHKHQNPVRPYRWTGNGYREVDEYGNFIEEKTKGLKAGKNVKSIKYKN